MVHRIIEFFLSIPAPLAILTVFLLTAGETTAAAGAGAASRAPSPRSDSAGGPGLFGASMKVRRES
jgi:hypothetical protein